MDSSDSGLVQNRMKLSGWVRADGGETIGHRRPFPGGVAMPGAARVRRRGVIREPGGEGASRAFNAGDIHFEHALEDVRPGSGGPRSACGRALFARLHRSRQGVEAHRATIHLPRCGRQSNRPPREPPASATSPRSRWLCLQTAPALATTRRAVSPPPTTAQSLSRTAPAKTVFRR